MTLTIGVYVVYVNRKLYRMLGYSIIILLFSMQLTATLGYFIGSTITVATFWVALAVSLLTMVWFFYGIYGERAVLKLYLINIAMLIMVIMFGAFLSNYFYDISWDGQNYHQEAIVELANNWNPFLDKPINIESNPSINPWLNHYAKGPWILAAIFYKLTGFIELGKIINILFLLASFIFALRAVSFFLPKSKYKSILLSLLLALNPVVITQLATFYIDGQLYSVLLIIISVAVLLWVKYNRWDLIIFALSLCLLVNVKFTALVYAVVIGALYFVALYIFKQKDLMKKVWLPMFAAFFISILVVGFNPYISNTINKGHPFYPLMGSDTVDIMTLNSPANFGNNSLFENVLLSIFSKSQNVKSPEVVELKIPFTVYKEEVKAFLIPDSRIGGYGPLFGGCIIVAFVLFLMSFRQLRVKVIYIIVPVLILLISVFINPEAWWARYTPQLWIIPVISVIAGLISNKKIMNTIARGLLTILFINVLLVSAFNLYEQFRSTALIKEQLVSIKNSGNVVFVENGIFNTNRIRFLENKIDYVQVKRSYCKNPTTFPRSKVVFCTE